MGTQLLFGIAGAAIGVLATGQYIRDMLAGKAQPHAYTWLIWSITQATAAAVAIQGGGGFGAIPLFAGTGWCLVVFVLSLKYGTRNITKSDTIVLIGALAAIVVWWQLHQPLLAVLLVTAIDVAGYIPTWRKSYEEPWSETLWPWAVYMLSNSLAILALESFNILTMTYLASLIGANLLVIVICLTRRAIVVAKPNEER